MPIHEISKQVVTGQCYGCDICGDRIDDINDLGWTHMFNTLPPRGWALCKNCCTRFPEEVLEWIPKKGNDWRTYAANSVFCCVCDINFEDEYGDEWNLNDGVWVFACHGEAEIWRARKLKSINDISDQAYDWEYREDIPVYLDAVLVDGKLRKFKKVWKIELEGEDVH